MKAVLLGATGMVGQGVLRECLRDERVTEVLVIGRTALGVEHPKLREILAPDLAKLVTRTDIVKELSGYDACFFCLGVSSAGMTEEAYHRVTYDLTLTVARALCTHNSNLTFVYVSGQGTDSTAQGRTMWARVKGKTENHLLALPMTTYLFRPGYIQPRHGITSRTPLYRALYAVTAPLYPLIRRLVPNQVTTTEHLGRAMIAAAITGAPQPYQGPHGINDLANSAR
ncbi:NAD-dependent epimerase/dehydratase family protein [Streptomyces uncialis]|uniref:NAD-dependent epimerase/dehydratase family protein n=1 Tax=Streptomyces uncialis TaxID=1048205 RepID=UPI003820DB06